LPIPAVGVTAGPLYARDLNDCLTIIDDHDHSSGNGVPINPAGIDITSDLTFNNENLTQARSLRMYVQDAPLALPADIGCLYVVGVDLYYNDDINQIRITQSGGVVGSSGNITGLVSPASATYVPLSTVFVWQSDANVPAYLDCSSIKIRNLLVNSYALTLAAPAAMGANYSLTLPALPATTDVVTLSAAGAFGTLTYDQVGQGMTAVGANAVANTRTRTVSTTVAIGGVAISASSGNFTGNSVTAADVTNLTVTITTGGRPVKVGLMSDGTTGNARGTLIATSTGGFASNATFYIVRGATVISQTSLGLGTATTQLYIPGSCCDYVDNVAAGTYTYKLQYIDSNANTLVGVNYLCLYAYEL
jgi:hypothetical protein